MKPVAEGPALRPQDYSADVDQHHPPDRVRRAEGPLERFGGDPVAGRFNLNPVLKRRWLHLQEGANADDALGANRRNVQALPGVQRDDDRDDAAGGEEQRPHDVARPRERVACRHAYVFGIPAESGPVRRRQRREQLIAKHQVSVSAEGFLQSVGQTPTLMRLIGTEIADSAYTSAGNRAVSATSHRNSLSHAAVPRDLRLAGGRAWHLSRCFPRSP